MLKRVLIKIKLTSYQSSNNFKGFNHLRGKIKTDQNAHKQKIFEFYLMKEKNKKLDLSP